MKRKKMQLIELLCNSRIGATKVDVIVRYATTQECRTVQTPSQMTQELSRLLNSSYDETIQFEPGDRLAGVRYFDVETKKIVLDLPNRGFWFRFYNVDQLLSLCIPMSSPTISQQRNQTL
jgi:hypothetical protein